MKNRLLLPGILLVILVAMFAQAWRLHTYAQQAGVPFRNLDSYMWAQLAEEVSQTGNAAWTHRDNAPHGRALHWATPFLRIMQAFQGIGFHWIGPLLFAGFLILVSGIVWRGSALLPAISAILLLSSNREVLLDFDPIGPDHHGLLFAAAFFCGYCLLAAKSWKWLIASAVSGAFGLWIHPQMALLIAAIGLGISCKTDSFTSMNLRLWGATGCTATLLFSFIEYGGSFLELRMERIHPLYGLCWLGGAEILARLGTKKERIKQRLCDWGICLLATLPMALTFLLIRFQPERVFHPLSRLEQEFFSRFSQFRPWIETHSLSDVWQVFGIFILFLLTISILRKAPHWPSMVAATFVVLLLCFQGRWDSLAVAFLIVFVIITQARLTEMQSRIFTGIAACFWLLVHVHSAFHKEPLDGTMRQAIVARDAASHLEEGCILFSDPYHSTLLGYFSGQPVITSFYWENMEGMRFFMNVRHRSGDRQIQSDFRSRKITTMVLFDHPPTHHVPQALKSPYAQWVYRRKPTPQWLELKADMSKYRVWNVRP